MSGLPLLTQLLSSLRKNKPEFLLAVCVFLVSVVVYMRCLSNGFVMDDNFHILANPWIKNPKYLAEIFKSDLWGYSGANTSLYRPLIHVLFMGVYFTFGTNPFGYHLVNLLLHGGVSIFFFLFTTQMLRKQQGSSPAQSLFPAFGAALLFATHPVHTENVAWVSGGMDLACAFFFLASLYWYASCVDGSRWRYGLSVGSFFLSTLCKEPALLLFPIFVCYDIAFARSRLRWPRVLSNYLPFSAVILVYGVLRFYALGGAAPILHSQNLTAMEYLLNGCVLFGRYVAMTIFPIGLNVWHVFEPVTSAATKTSVEGMLISGVFLCSLAICARRPRGALLAHLLFVLPLLPVLYLPGLTQGIENAFAERYLYLPSIGFSLLIAIGLSNLHRLKTHWQKLAMSLLVVVVTLYSIASVSRAAVWKDAYTLWSDAALKSPQSGRPHIALGDAYRDRGSINEAIEEYRVALTLIPDTMAAGVYADLGMLYARQGFKDNGIAYLRKSLELDPENAIAHNYLGVICGESGKHQEAIEHLQTALRLKPNFEDAYRHLGIAYFNAGQVERSIEPFEHAIALNPDDADAHNNLGVSFAVLGMRELALEHFKKAVQLDPEDAAAQANLNRALQMAQPRK